MTRAEFEANAWQGATEARAAFARANLDHVLELDVPPVDNAPHWHHFSSQ